jgi:hypothetical protein
MYLTENVRNKEPGKQCIPIGSTIVINNKEPVGNLS